MGSVECEVWSGEWECDVESVECRVLSMDCGV